MSAVATPVVIRPRYRCPFHGLDSFGLSEAGESQCADGWAIECQMQTAGQTPDWEACPRFDPQAIARLEAQGFIAHPAEFREGIPIRQWYDYVMADTTPRPDPVGESVPSRRVFGRRTRRSGLTPEESFTVRSRPCKPGRS